MPGATGPFFRFFRTAPRRTRARSTFGGHQAELSTKVECLRPKSATLVRVLDLSPDCRSMPGIMLRWLGLFLLARASSHVPRFSFCKMCSSAVPSLKTRDEVSVSGQSSMNIGFRIIINSTHPCQNKKMPTCAFRGAGDALIQ